MHVTVHSEVEGDCKAMSCPVLCSPGTDINGALQKAIKLLNNYVAQNDIEDRSVSLIVFLTDGKPTFGETNTVKILSNTKEATGGQICIFTIGIGNDVDFKLLEKLSLENCGLTRRVLEEEKAGAQLIGSVVCLLVTRGWGGA